MHQLYNFGKLDVRFDYNKNLPPKKTCDFVLFPLHFRHFHSPMVTPPVCLLCFLYVKPLQPPYANLLVTMELFGCMAVPRSQSLESSNASISLPDMGPFSADCLPEQRKMWIKTTRDSRDISNHLLATQGPTIWVLGGKAGDQGPAADKSWWCLERKVFWCQSMLLAMWSIKRSAEVKRLKMRECPQSFT